MRNETGTEAPLQSVDRALEVLEIVAASRTVGVSEVGRRLGIHKSTAFRLLAALERRGYVERDERAKYRLGVAVLRLAGAASVTRGLTSIAREPCELLARSTGLTVNLALREHDRVVNVFQVHAGPGLTTVDWVGQPTPLHATSSGKVLLASLNGSLLEQLLRRRLDAFTERTIVDADELRRELGRVRAAGWAATVEELEPNLNAVAAPIRGHDGAVVAAISASGPTHRLPPSHIPQVGTTVAETAAALSSLLGHVPDG